MNRLVLAARKIYLDANIIIYFVERNDKKKDDIIFLFDFANRNKIELYCSEIGVAECLYGAYKHSSTKLEEIYNEIFYDLNVFQLCPIDAERAKQAARIGAELSLKLIDALHFQAALETGCDVFITNDQRIRSSLGVTVVQLAALGSDDR